MVTQVSGVRIRKTRRPRMTKVVHPAETVIESDLSQERVQSERILASPLLKRQVGSFARANGLSMPRAWRDLVMAGLAAKKQGEANYGSGQSTASVG